jgi:hypothetical protein
MSPLMVAFGPAEAQALNLAARPLWLELYGHSLAAPSPPGSDLEVTLGERRYAVGDRVVALRRIGAATSATSGSVVALGAGSVTVEWQGPTGPWRGEVGREHARTLGYGYATTVPYLRSFDQGTQRFVVLGDPLELATRSARAVSAWVTVPGAGVPAFGAGGLAARRRAALAELATNWPDDEMLELAGPRPLGLTGRRRWAEIVVACAIGRDLGLVNAFGMRMDTALLGPGDVPHLDVAGRGMARTVSRPASRRPETAPETASSRRPGRNVLPWRDLPSPHVPGL